MATLYAGTSGFAYPAWKPGFYPAKLPAKLFLKHYAERLNSVEINYTFRRLPSSSTLKSWVEATPPGFVFAVKANQRITHILRLKNAQEATELFLKMIDPLRTARRLGPILFQLGPTLKCPVGMLLFQSISRYWTVAEQNTLWMPFSGLFLWNRVVWCSVGLAALAGVYLFFPMSVELLTVRRRRKPKAIGQESTAPPAPKFHNLLPKVSTAYSWPTRLRQFASLTRIYFRNIFREIPFWAITLLLIGFSMINGHFAGTRDGYNVWPVT